MPDDAGGQYHFFNYKWCTRATFPDVREATSERDRLLRLLKRECRGLVFHEDAQGHVTVAARRFHKFFNIGERDDTHESLVDLSRPHRLLVKHDGSLVGPVLLPSGRVRFATKSGFGDITRMVEERFLSLPENAVYLRWSAEWLRGEPTHHVLPTSSLIGGGALPAGFSPMFEYVSQRNKIVLDYDRDELILLALRHVRTGLYYPYEDMRASALAAGLRVTEPLDGAHFASTAEMVAQLHHKEHCEGFVIQFDDGSMYKVKTEWYFSRANQKEKQTHSFGTERAVWELVLKQEVDDAAALMDPVLRNQVAAFSVRLFEAVVRLGDAAVAFCRPHAALSKRDFVALARNPENGSALPAALLFVVFDALASGGDAADEVLAWCLKMTLNVKSLEQLRAVLAAVTELGELRFSERVGMAGNEEGDAD